MFHLLIRPRPETRPGAPLRFRLTLLCSQSELTNVAIESAVVVHSGRLFNLQIRAWSEVLCILCSCFPLRPAIVSENHALSV